MAKAEQVVLLKGNQWKFGDVALTAIGAEDEYYTPLKSISEEDLVAVNKAIVHGILGIAKDPKLKREYAALAADKAKRVPRTTKKHTGRLEWTALDKVRESKRQLPARSPSLAARTADYTGDKRAFRLLQEPNERRLVALVPAEVAKCPTEKDKGIFLRELEYIESNGYNANAGARTKIIDLIQVMLKPFNKGPMSISPVMTTED